VPDVPGGGGIADFDGPAIVAMYIPERTGSHVYDFISTFIVTDALVENPTWSLLNGGLPDHASYSQFIEPIYHMELDPYDTKRAVATGEFGLAYNPDWTTSSNWVVLKTLAELRALINVQHPAITSQTNADWLPAIFKFSPISVGTLDIMGTRVPVRVTNYYNTPTYKIGPKFDHSSKTNKRTAWHVVEVDTWTCGSIVMHRTNANLSQFIAGKTDDHPFGDEYLNLHRLDWSDTFAVDETMIPDYVELNPSGGIYPGTPAIYINGEIYFSGYDKINRISAWDVDPVAYSSAGEYPFIHTVDVDAGQKNSIGVTSDGNIFYFFRHPLVGATTIPAVLWWGTAGSWSTKNLPGINHTVYGSGSPQLLPWGVLKHWQGDTTLNRMFLGGSRYSRESNTVEGDPFLIKTEDRFATYVDLSGNMETLLPAGDFYLSPIDIGFLGYSDSNL
jgi:hypothetical protein